MEKRFKNWKKYEIVRRSGKFNMIMEAVDASREAGLEMDEYEEVLKTYGETMELIEREYGSVNNFMKGVN